jgi:hypothetical protein
VPRDGEAVRVKLPPKGPPPAWLPKAEELYRGGLTLEQVGEACGVSGATVGKRFRDYGIATRKPFEAYRPPKQPRKPPPWFDRAVALYAEGLSLGQVAERVGISDRRVGDIFRREGVKIRPRPVARLTEDEAHDAVLLHRHGHSLERIAGLMQTTAWAVRKVLDYAKRHPAGQAAPDAAQKGHA